ncbi:MAG: sigma-70 family RNA polymerase sigma factor [Prevotella sp.]|nr:sigma-70 family RNA polymerase sigma factor [Prevotella sp.]MDY4854011.1 sigma-70 family RNA polymerase sigma factor [Prevotella sp.]
MKEYTKMTDEELVVAYMDGEARAFDVILTRYQATIYSYFLYVVGDEDEANELFQDTFVKVIVFLQEQRYKPMGLFNYWLIRIAHNMISDKFRRNDHKLVKDVNAKNDLTRIRNEAITVSPYDDEMIRDQAFDELHRMVNKLPAEQREMVYLRYFEEMSFKDIAAITGVSINTALGRMRYAILNLRKMANVAIL